MPNSQSVPAYPLQWPAGVPRTKSPRRSAFKATAWNSCLKDLAAELGLMSARYVTISTNMKLRQDGQPYAQQGRMDDPSVAVYFTTVDGEQVCLPCDRWETMGENLRAIVSHISSMRGQKRWGVGTAKQAFAGYKTLTAVAGEDESWWIVLGVSRSATVEQIMSAYRAAAAVAHPDRGGSSDQMARINTARDRALAERR